MIALLIASFCMVALRAFQQLNVMHDRRLWVPPTSFGMAIAEVSIVLSAIQQGWWSWVPMGIGGSVGCLLAMWLHGRMRKAGDAG